MTLSKKIAKKSPTRKAAAKKADAKKADAKEALAAAPAAAPAPAPAAKATPSFNREANAILAAAIREGQGAEIGIANGNANGEIDRPRRGAYSEDGSRAVNLYRVIASVVRDLTADDKTVGGGAGEREILPEVLLRVGEKDPTYSAATGKVRYRTFLREVRNRAEGGKDSGKGPYGAGEGRYGDETGPIGGVVYARNAEDGSVRLRYVRDAKKAIGYSRSAE